MEILTIQILIIKIEKREKSKDYDTYYIQYYLKIRHLKYYIYSYNCLTLITYFYINSNYNSIEI